MAECHITPCVVADEFYAAVAEMQRLLPQATNSVHKSLLGLLQGDKHLEIDHSHLPTAAGDPVLIFRSSKAFLDLLAAARTGEGVAVVV